MSSHPEFRRDPVSGRWAVIAPERSHRPKTLEGAEPRHRRDGERTPCPFCPGQEYDTPHEVLAYRIPGSVTDGPGWQLRVVPNKFPAVQPDVGHPFETNPEIAFLAQPGMGRAEVLIECPEHLPDPTLLTPAQFADVFRAYRDRLVVLAAEPLLNYAAVFKNVGAEAGASLGHTHSQIIATPFVPQSIEVELAGAAMVFARTGRCVFCDLIQQEIAADLRLIAQSERFVVIAAFAPRFDFEFWVIPRSHFSRYESIDDAGCLDLAQLMLQVLRALDIVAEQPAYNWFLHTAPLHQEPLPHYHWHLEVLPRIARPAGLEWGFGCFIASVPPETAAIRLREALVDPDRDRSH